MELLIIRHAKAEDHGHPGGDGARALVAKGLEQSERLGRFLKRIDRRPDVVLTSPLVRARQTAETMCQAAEMPGPVVQGWLACGMDPEAAIRELVAFSDFERVAIVGHEPDLSSLIEWLLGCSGSSVEVKKASITGLLVHPPAWHARLLFHIPPAMLGE
ncbi:phosphohistidine phosphatase SixA [Luteolibacter luteus]|uniref:Phosphohistidine phosphatase SixA n=1 Tax=Luteolibacter luteus TaxID=2728835 RepID=A0A858RP81_9BACT|nr:phosphohistidine phosphatase SixA [Luteolibacter luteus]QJE98208.1 phosphohistidine phosphatase SixA [Luteolibacter luteus]